MGARLSYTPPQPEKPALAVAEGNTDGLPSPRVALQWRKRKLEDHIEELKLDTDREPIQLSNWAFSFGGQPRHGASTNRGSEF